MKPNPAALRRAIAQAERSAKWWEARGMTRPAARAAELAAEDRERLAQAESDARREASA